MKVKKFGCPTEKKGDARNERLLFAVFRSENFTSRLKKTGFHDILYHELELIYGGIVKWDIVYF